MAVRIISFAEGEYYHIYNRGNNKNIIFHDNQDYEHFIELLTTFNTESRVRLKRFSISEDKKENIISIGAYCLMPNHFHILIKQEKKNGISKFLQKVSTAYVMYYNKKYQHTGGIFEGKFKSKYAGVDAYLKYLFAYIHLNPLKILDKNWKLKAKHPPKEMLKFLTEYKYSSFQEYKTNTFNLVNKNAFPNYFKTESSFLKDITAWFIQDPYLLN